MSQLFLFAEVAEAWRHEALGGSSKPVKEKGGRMWWLDVWPVKRRGWMFSVTDPRENTTVGRVVATEAEAKRQAGRMLVKMGGPRVGA